MQHLQVHSALLWLSPLVPFWPSASLLHTASAASPRWLLCGSGVSEAGVRARPALP